MVEGGIFLFEFVELVFEDHVFVEEFVVFERGVLVGVSLAEGLELELEGGYFEVVLLDDLLV